MSANRADFTVQMRAPGVTILDAGSANSGSDQ